MSFEDLISRYGVLAVFIGAAVEGETAVFIGGVFAHRQFLGFCEVAAAAVCGSFLADQAWFFAGRYANRLAFVQRALKTEAASKVSRLLEAHPTTFILSFRFIYGMRTVSPILIGLSAIPTLRFVVLNFIAALVWGILITSIGYFFGNAVEALFGRLKTHSQLLILIVPLVAAIVTAAYMSRRWLLRRRQKAAPSPAQREPAD